MKPRRRKALIAKASRCNGVVAVLENPSNSGNVGAVIRNANALGVRAVYVVTDKWKTWNCLQKDRSVHNASTGSIKVQYARCFPSSESCLAHLAQRGYVSFGTSPHAVDLLRDVETKVASRKRVAIWFGSEKSGLDRKTVAAMDGGMFRIDTSGMVESMNLAVSTGIVLHSVTTARRALPGYKVNRAKRKAMRKLASK